MTEEQKKFATIKEAQEFHKRPENKLVPALKMWEMLSDVSIESMTKDEVDWFTGIGLQLVATFNKYSLAELTNAGIDIYAIAERTDQAHKRFYP